MYRCCMAPKTQLPGSISCAEHCMRSTHYMSRRPQLQAAATRAQNLVVTRRKAHDAHEAASKADDAVSEAEARQWNVQAKLQTLSGWSVATHTTVCEWTSREVCWEASHGTDNGSDQWPEPAQQQLDNLQNDRNVLNAIKAMMMATHHMFQNTQSVDGS